MVLGGGGAAGGDGRYEVLGTLYYPGREKLYTLQFPVVAKGIC